MIPAGVSQHLTTLVPYQAAGLALSYLKGLPPMTNAHTPREHVSV